MKKADRIKMVKAMEYIARQIKDSTMFESWAVCGVEYGDIEYGDVSDTETKYIGQYIDDERFSELMACFLERMQKAKQYGGLCCDGVTSAK